MKRGWWEVSAGTIEREGGCSEVTDWGPSSVVHKTVQSGATRLDMLPTAANMTNIANRHMQGFIFCSSRSSRLERSCLLETQVHLQISIYDYRNICSLGYIYQTMQGTLLWKSAAHL
jgi:hypothetical protein